jgi:hypothetical protein
MRPYLCRLLIAALIPTALLTRAATIHIAPPPAGEVLSDAFVVQVNGQTVPVYVAKVAPADTARRWKAMDDKAHSADYFETASFATFDMEGAVTITVTCPELIQTAKVLPSALHVVPKIEGKSLTLTLSEPHQLTVEVNGRWVQSVHLFANPLELAPPAPSDPGVIYFGPGIHEVTHMTVTNNQTVYLAPGALVRAVIGPDEPYQISSYSGLRGYSPTFQLRGTNITVRGRGILDAGRCTTHARHPLLLQGTNLTLEGIILRDSSTWTVPIRRSQHVHVQNVKLLGYRANSDGIDICNSRDVLVEGCFIRTLDDLIVVKTDQNQGGSSHLVARDCVLWNEVAHALSIGAELREEVSDVLFSNCDVIHDKGREWTLRVYHCDSARISRVRFENLRIEESPRLISLWIGTAVWTRDSQRGHIKDVSFRNIQAEAHPLRVELTGFDAAHQVEDVVFENVVVNGRELAPGDVKTNAFVKNVTDPAWTVKER